MRNVFPLHSFLKEGNFKVYSGMCNHHAFRYYRIYLFHPTNEASEAHRKKAFIFGKELQAVIKSQ